MGKNNSKILLDHLYLNVVQMQKQLAQTQLQLEDVRAKISSVRLGCEVDEEQEAKGGSNDKD